MRRYRLWIAVAVAAFVAASAAHLYFVALAGFPPSLSGPMTPWAIFAEAFPLSKMLMAAPVLMSLAAAFIAWRSARDPSPGLASGVEGFLRLMALGAVGLGAMAAGYGELLSRMAVAATGITRPEVLAPGRAESMLALALGFLSAAAILACAAYLSRASAER